MARKARVAPSVDDDLELIEEYYRDRLTRPAEFPSQRFQPVYIGPTWQTTPDGHWLLPERTLGWSMLAWSGRWLQHNGQPWRYTDEQARFLLHWYALDEHGDFLYRDGVLQRLKGWGKDPLGACICSFELVGPCRFAGWADDGRPVGAELDDAWVQTAAVSLEQTKNTMRLLPSLFSDEAKARFYLAIGKETVYAYADRRLLQAVTSSPATLEGARASCVLMNETHHWLANNSGHDMADVIERNATKSVGGTARTLRITNAFDPGVDSVAERDREAWEAVQAGTAVETGLLYDSVEAPPEAMLTVEDAPEVVAAIRGDATWLNIPRIVQSIADRRNPPSRSRRFWYNQIVAAEDAWADPRDWDRCLATDRVPPLVPGEEIAAFFDGSKSDDATGLVACRISDGLVATLGMWQKPPGERGKGWTAPRAVVDDAVDRMFEEYNVAAFFGDPSHVQDDETQERYWDGLFDDWHRRFGTRLELWATPGRDGHSVMWDMASPRRVEQFTAAAERCALDIEEHKLIHDGDGRLRSHVRNARRYPNKYGVSLWKGHRESPRKIDLAVCMVGARMVRRLVLNNPNRKRPRSGKVW